MSPPHYSVRHGAAVVHVASEHDLVTVLQLTNDSCTDGPHNGWLANLSAKLLEAGSRSCPGAQLRSLRDMLFHMKGSLDGPDSKFVNQLLTAYSCCRHVSASEAEARVRTIVAKIARRDKPGGGHGPAAQRSAPPSATPRSDPERRAEAATQSPFGPWADAAAAQGLTVPPAASQAKQDIVDAFLARMARAEEQVERLSAQEVWWSSVDKQLDGCMSRLQGYGERLTQVDAQLAKYDERFAQVERRSGEPFSRPYDERLELIDKELATSGKHVEELLDALKCDRLEAMEAEFDDLDHLVKDNLAQLGDVRMSDVLAAVQAAAMNMLTQRPDASEANAAAVTAQLREYERGFKDMQQDLDDVVTGGRLGAAAGLPHLLRQLLLPTTLPSTGAAPLRRRHRRPDDDVGGATSCSRKDGDGGSWRGGAELP